MGFTHQPAKILDTVQWIKKVVKMNTPDHTLTMWTQGCINKHSPAERLFRRFITFTWYTVYFYLLGCITRKQVNNNEFYIKSNGGGTACQYTITPSQTTYYKNIIQYYNSPPPMEKCNFILYKSVHSYLFQVSICICSQWGEKNIKWSVLCTLIIFFPLFI